MSIPVIINPVGVIGSVSITMGYPKNSQEYIDWLWLEWFRSRLKNATVFLEGFRDKVFSFLVSLVLGTSCIDHRFPNHHHGTQRQKLDD
jgi:hypothetical protein